MEIDYGQLAAQATLIGAGVAAIGYIAKSTTATLVGELKALREVVATLQKKSDDGDKFHQDVSRELGQLGERVDSAHHRLDRLND